MIRRVIYREPPRGPRTREDAEWDRQQRDFSRQDAKLARAIDRLLGRDESGEATQEG